MTREEILEQVTKKQDELIALLKEQISTHERIRALHEDYIKFLQAKIARLLEEKK